MCCPVIYCAPCKIVCLLISGEVCNGILGDAYTCCSPSNQCGPNQGDCDSDSECSGSLVCGTDNCKAPFPSDADCCTGNSRKNGDIRK